MAIAGIQVNTSGAGEVAFGLIPKGKVEALIQGHEIKSDNQSMAISFPFLIISGPSKDRKIFERATIQSSNPKATAFGMRVLNSLGKAVLGKPEGDWSDADLAALKGKRVILDIDIEPERTDPTTGKVYQARNRINGYEPAVITASSSYAPAAPMQQAPMQQAYAAPQQAYAPALQQPPQQYAQAQPQGAWNGAGMAPQAAATLPAPSMQQQPQLPPQSNYAAPPPAAAAPQPAAQAPTWMAGATG